MNNLARTLIAGSAMLTALLSPSFADNKTSDGSQILNGQVNISNAHSELNAVVYNVAGSAALQSTAAGNVVDITTMNDTHVSNDQYTSAWDISSNVNTKITNVDGDVGISNQAVCNSATVSTDPIVTAVNSKQVCAAVDPSAEVNATAYNIGGNFVVNNSAVGNTLEADSNATNMPINNIQTNLSGVNAKTNVNVSNVAGSVSLTSTAVGNNAQVVHYSTN